LIIFWFYGLWPSNDAWPQVLGLMYLELLMIILTPAMIYVVFGLYTLFYLRTETESSFWNVVFNKKTERWIMSKRSIIEQQSYSSAAWCSCSFCSHCLWTVWTWIFQGDGQEEEDQLCGPPCSPDLTPLDSLLWGCMKDQVYSHRIYWMNSKQQMLQRTCYSMSGKRWAIGCDHWSLCSVSHLTTFPLVCNKAVSIDE
jgi:hypothetical protein